MLVTTDVSEQRRLGDALLRSEEFRRLIVDNLPDFVLLIDRQRVCHWVNRLAPNMVLADIIGRSIDSLITPETLPQVKLAIESVFETGLPAQYEVEGYGDGVQQAWYSTRVVPIASASGIETVLLMTSDATQRKRAELALRQSEERFRALTEHSPDLIAIVDRSRVNLLQVIQTNLQLAGEVAAPSGLALAELSEALRATERAAELTTHLLAIGRRQRVDPRTVELSALIERSLRMLRRVIPETIEVSFEGSTVPCFVSVDSPQVEQVLLNLCLNARDAMAGGGRLSVGVRVFEGSPKLARLSVTDTGTGIAEEALKQVFEPFFTTKRAGSGLGLAVAAGIVAAHGGVISARSRLEQGSTFTVDFPLTAAAPAEETARPKSDVQGDELVLVAETSAPVASACSASPTSHKRCSSACAPCSTALSRAARRGRLDPVMLSAPGARCCMPGNCAWSDRCWWC